MINFDGFLLVLKNQEIRVQDRRHLKIVPQHSRSYRGGEKPFPLPQENEKMPGVKSWLWVLLGNELFAVFSIDETTKPRGKTRCERARERRLQKRKTRPGAFVPRCKANGEFKATQCHKRTKYCWCVNREGKPIQETKVKYRKPSCRTG